MVKHDKSRFNASQSAQKARSGELAKLWAGDVAFGGQGSEEQSGERSSWSVRYFTVWR